ncbi:hypothetical protein M3Y98_00048100 [Aphelenchoides besseyi]|nr:hypothetical protein M3Y98_00048100 [Aphelenchoides besseyi]
MAEETKNAQRFAAEGLRIEHVLHKLEKPSCFIGLFDEKGVETCLTEDGVFAVWAEDHGSFCKMNLSVRWDNRIHHIAILQKNGGTIFSLTAEETPFKFSTVKELIDKCSGTGLQVEGKKVELKTPAKRPQWLLNGAELMISVAMEAKLGKTPRATLPAFIAESCGAIKFSPA